MHFKKGSTVAFSLVLGIIACSLGSCSLRLNESPPDSNAQSLGGVDLGCLQGTSDIFSDYVSGKAQESGLNRIFTCASHSLQIFAERTKGAEPGQFSGKELRNFLERYFLGGTKISDQLLDEVMELKRSILGGTADAITVQEVARAREILETLRMGAVLTRQDLPLNTAHFNALSEDRLETAIGHFVTASEAFGAALERTNVAYSLERFEKLLLAMEPIYQGDAPKVLREMLPTIRALKSILVGSSVSEIEGNEWRRLFRLGARWYGLWLREEQLKAVGLAYDYGQGHDRLMGILSDASKLIEDAIQHHPGGIITFEEIDQLIDSGKSDVYYPFWNEKDKSDYHNLIAVKKTTLKRFMIPLIQRVFGGDDGGPSGREAKGLTLGAVQRIWEVISRWSEGQHFLQEIYLAASAGFPGSPFEGDGFTAAQLFPGESGLTDFQKSLSGEISVDINVRDELRSLILSPNTKLLFKSGEKEILFDEDRDHPPHFTFHNWSQVNWMRHVARVLFKAYVDDPDRAKSLAGVTVEEFGRLVLDFKDLGIDLTLIDPRGWENLSLRRFREANLFTYAGNGDELMSLDEGSDFLAFMVSASSVADRVHNRIAQECQGHLKWKEDPIYHRPSIETDCFWSVFFSDSEVPGFLGHMPHLLQILSQKDRSSALKTSVISAIAGLQPDPTSLDLGDSETLMGLLQYVQALFVRFSHDAGWVLTEPDLAKAYPVFERTLMEIVKAQGRSPSEGDLYEIYTYLLQNGKQPDALQFLTWKYWRHKRTKMSVDQARVVDIFSQLGKLTPEADAQIRAQSHD